MTAEEIVKECFGCGKITTMNTCISYLYPESKWMNGKKCPLATHLEKKEEVKMKALDPIKASKRSR